MPIAVVNVNEANARFEKRNEHLLQECEKLVAEINDTVAGTSPDTDNRWYLNGYSTRRVAYVGVSEYEKETIDSVSNIFQAEGYTVNLMVMGVGSDEDEEGPATMRVLAVLWDPDIFGNICDAVSEGVIIDGEELVPTCIHEFDDEDGEEEHEIGFFPVDQEENTDEEVAEEGGEGSADTDFFVQFAEEGQEGSGSGNTNINAENA